MRFLKDTKKYWNYSKYSAKSILSSEVAGSYLNWLWWIFNPFCMMLIYAFIFGYVFKKTEHYFPAFIFLGLTLWDYFNRTINKSIKIVKSNKAIVTKVYLPKFVLVQVEMMVSFVKMLFSFGVLIALLIVLRVPISYRVVYIVPIFVILSLFTFGICCIVLHFGVFVEDLSNITKILLRFIYYGTGIFYSVETRIKNVRVRNALLHYNPLAYLIQDARKVFLYMRNPSWKWMILWTVMSLILCWIGVRLIYKYENSYAKVV